MSRFVCFNFEDYTSLVKFDENVSVQDIYNRISELSEDGTLQDMDYDEIIEAVLEDMNIVNYEFVDVASIDMITACEMN